MSSRMRQIAIIIFITVLTFASTNYFLSSSFNTHNTATTILAAQPSPPSCSPSPSPSPSPRLGHESFVVFYMQGPSAAAMETTAACLASHATVRTVTFKESDGDIFYPDSTWAGTRNYASVHATLHHPPSAPWKWVCHVDGDIVLDNCDNLAGFLKFLDRNPHLYIAHPIVKPEKVKDRARIASSAGLGDADVHAIPKVTQDDEPFMCYTAQARTTLNIPPFGSDQNWWLEAHYLMFKIALSGFAVDHFAMYYDLVANNANHDRDYPHGSIPPAEEAFERLNAALYHGRLSPDCLSYFSWEPLSDGIEEFASRPCCTLQATQTEPGETLVCAKDIAHNYAAMVAKYVTKETEEDTPSFSQGKRVISYCLYGGNERYAGGAIRNLPLAAKYFPGWEVRIYHDESVPETVLGPLRSLGANLVLMSGSGKIEGMFWRFHVAADPDVDIYIVRDSDSRLSEREAAAVQEWLDSGEPFHVIRDHPAHGVHAVSGGLWGGRKIIDGIVAAMDNNHVAKDSYLDDMVFLANFVWPIMVRDGVFQHDAFTCQRWGGRSPLMLRNDADHLGAVFEDAMYDLRPVDEDSFRAALPEPCIGDYLPMPDPVRNEALQKLT